MSNKTTSYDAGIKPLTIRVPEELIKRVRVGSAELDVNIYDFGRAALEFFLAAPADKRKAALEAK